MIIDSNTYTIILIRFVIFITFLIEITGLYGGQNINRSTADRQLLKIHI